MELLQIMIFSTRKFDQKNPHWTLVKKPLSHFGQVIFDMTNLIGDLFD
jgi:hypothetical protein